MDITFRTGAVHGVSLREVGAIDRCRKVPRQGSHQQAFAYEHYREKAGEHVFKAQGVGP